MAVLKVILLGRVARDRLADLGFRAALAKESRDPVALLLLANRVATIALVFLGVVDVYSSGTISADLPSTDTMRSVAEDERCNDVGNTKGDGDYAGAHDCLPDLEGYVLVVVGAVAKRAEMVTADKDHGDAEPGESALLAESWPVGRNKILTGVKRSLCPEQETGDEDNKGQGNVVKELKTIGHLGVDHHDDRDGHDGQKDSDITTTDNLKDDKGRALESRASLSAQHFVYPDNT